MAASPCLSPYVLFHSWPGAVAAFLVLPGETLAAVVGLWVLVGDPVAGAVAADSNRARQPGALRTAHR